MHCFGWFIKSLIHCRSPQSQQRVGVEMLEASVADLNPFKLRKTHQFGKYKYDPGKYYGSEKNKVKNQDERENDDDEIDEVDQAEVSLDKASYDDEIEAPWNQYAWAEELRLRVRYNHCNLNIVEEQMLGKCCMLLMLILRLSSDIPRYSLLID